MQDYFITAHTRIFLCSFVAKQFPTVSTGIFCDIFVAILSGISHKEIIEFGWEKPMGDSGSKAMECCRDEFRVAGSIISGGSRAFEKVLSRFHKSFKGVSLDFRRLGGFIEISKKFQGSFNGVFWDFRCF